VWTPHSVATILAMGSSVTDSPGHHLAAQAHLTESNQAVSEAICELNVTATDAEWLAALARALLDDRLVACANIFSVRSVYHWESAVQDHLESRAAFHTRLSLFNEVSAKVSESHPYDVPAIFAVPLAAVSDSYRSWVLDQTQPPGEAQPSAKIAHPGKAAEFDRSAMAVEDMR